MHDVWNDNNAESGGLYLCFKTSLTAGVDIVVGVVAVVLVANIPQFTADKTGRAVVAVGAAI